MSRAKEFILGLSDDWHVLLSRWGFESVSLYPTSEYILESGSMTCYLSKMQDLPGDEVVFFTIFDDGSKVHHNFYSWPKNRELIESHLVYYGFKPLS